MSVDKNRVPILNQSYLNYQEQQSIYAKRKKKMLIRRLTVFFVFVAIILFVFIQALVTQSQTLTEKETKLKEVQAQYKELKENQKILKEEITKLQDDEYIGKYARQEYYLSDDGEIIFSVPEQ
ncbi:FtsB family cell division protein [Bacillus andreraoultii]|uniref:FtsB family cell division protein n=1 Tax=Bacillus andreraoultii TaxID=1499685 RepID=UPI00053A86F5|nr:septum formation initiator family protein [Bacillus andreraoultii]